MFSLYHHDCVCVRTAGYSLTLIVTLTQGPQWAANKMWDFKNALNPMYDT